MVVGVKVVCVWYVLCLVASCVWSCECVEGGVPCWGRFKAKRRSLECGMVFCVKKGGFRVGSGEFVVRVLTMECRGRSVSAVNAMCMSGMHFEWV